MAKIKNSKKFDKIVFLVLITSTALVISKIIVFVNSLNKRIILVIYL